MSQSLLTVFGATGQQGGSVIRHVLDHPILSKKYKLRGVTRDTNKPASKELEQSGVDMVKADMDDSASLQEAMKGSFAVFAVTNFWEKISYSSEVAQGKAMADAAVASGAKLLIWSSLPAISKITNGKTTAMVHFDSKAEVEEYIRTLPITSVFYMAGFYMQNQKQFWSGKKENGAFLLEHSIGPNDLVPLIDITDTGAYCAPVLLSPERYHHKRFMAATYYKTPVQMAKGMEKALGQPVRYQNVSAVDLFRDRFPSAMADHFIKTGMEKSFGTDWIYFGPEGEEGVKWTVEQVESVGGKLGTWEEYVKRDGPWV